MMKLHIIITPPDDGEQIEEESGDESMGGNPNNFPEWQLLSEASSSFITRRCCCYKIYGEPTGLLDTESSSVVERHSKMDRILQKIDLDPTTTPFIFFCH